MRLITRHALSLLILLMIFVFSLLNPDFFSLSNLKNILEQNAPLAIVAVGTTFMIICNNIDLSPGSSIALSSVMVGLVFTQSHSMALAVFCGILFTVCTSLFNGFMVVKFNINSVIITLAAYLWMRGLALGFTKADSINLKSPFIDAMNHFSIVGISIPILLIIFIYVLGGLLLYRTRLGRYTYALGGDEQATKHAGIKVDYYKLLIFAFNGLMIGIASIISVSRVASAQPNSAYGMELDAIAAVIIGGNKLTGGEGSLQRTLRGVLFISILNNGLNALGMKDAYFYFFKGVFILIALLIEISVRKQWPQRMAAITRKG